MKATASLNRVKVPDIALPTGGGTVRGADENYHTNAYTGTAEFSIPVPLPSSRAWTPSLQISYNSSSGNSILGMGFHMGQSAISIKTNRAYPRYNDRDIYTLDDAELVFASTETIQENGEELIMDTYLERFQLTFSLIQRVSSKDNVYWKVTSNDNTCIIYGDTAASRIADPLDDNRIFTWYVAKHTDAIGNIVQYAYTKLDPQDANIYLTDISYGNYHSANDEDVFAFKVWIDYGQLDLQLSRNSLHFNPVTQQPSKRRDIICSYRSGFAVRTQYLVKHILVVHNFPEESTAGEDCITTVMEMSYNDVVDAMACSALLDITEYGATRNAGNDYRIKAMPPVLLEYTSFNQQKLSFTPITDEKGRIFNQPLNLVDFQREGLPGILYRNAETLYFYEAKGNGVFQTPEHSLTAPNRYSDPGLPMSIVSLEGNGELQLELNNEQYSGYYALDNKEQWQPFTSFPNIALNNVPAYTEHPDLSGDNQADELLITPGALFYRESLGLEGMSTDLQELTNTHALEAENIKDPYVYYGFENIFGDGMQHLVKMTGNTLTIWPSLGYGNFGAAVTLTLPVMEQSEINLQQRLLLADVSGSGTLDIVHIYQDRIEVCFSYGGLSFSAPQTFTFESSLQWTDTDHIQFTDVAGKGNVCMILSKLSPHTYNDKFQDLGHYFYEFNGGTDNYCRKPFLLKNISCNGLSKTIQYQSSLQYLLSDRATQPWYTKLPFPVIVVAGEPVPDLVSNNNYTHEYSYRDGYYDPVEHLFFGFGCCTTQNITTDTPGALSKTWFHLGNGLDEVKMRAQFFDSGKDYSNIPCDCSAAGESTTALSGKILHEEEYGLDDMTCPFTAESSTWQLICTQAAVEGREAIYRSYDCQTVSFDYERRADDPLVQHAFVLLADEFTHTICTAQLSYPRRSALIPEQETQFCTGNTYLLKNQTTSGQPRRVGVPLFIQSFEITGLKPASGNIYGFEELKQQLVDQNGFLNQLPPSGQPGNEVAARLISWNYQYYWADESQQAVWQPDMELPAILLEQCSATLSFDDSDVNKMLQGKVQPEELTTAGYVHDETGYWWTRSARAYYGPITEFCMIKHLRYDWVDSTDPLYTSTTVIYDTYCLNALSNSQWLNKDTSLTTHTAIDYSLMLPYRVTDINGNYGEVLYDECGQVIATAAIDKSGKSGDTPLKDFKQLEVTDPDDVFRHPLKYLQGAGSFVYYQFAKQANGQWQPGFTLALSRTRYKSDDDITIQRSISYTDGLGRHLETRAFKGGTDAPWLVSGHVTYNSGGEVKEQYVGHFSNTWQYEQDWAGNIRDTLLPPTRFTYDATGRQIMTFTPKGFMEASLVLNAWETRQYDENDTILESTYYKSGDWNNDPQEKDAITKAVACYNTPSTHVSDGLGRVILTIADNASGKTVPIDWKQSKLSAADINAKDPTLEVSWQSYDIIGRILLQQDARFREQGTTNYNFEHIHPVTSGLLYTLSTDNNITYGYLNVHGKLISQWDGVGIRHTFEYDNLQRKIKRKVQTPEGYSPVVNQVVDVVIYGESNPAGVTANMMGVLWKHYNEGGLAYADAFTFDHHPVSEHFRFRKDYKTEPDWQSLADDLLEEEVFTTVNTYNAAGKLIATTMPDGTASTWSYSPLSYCQQSGIQVQGSGSIQPVLTDVGIDANGLLTNISYANGINTVQKYDPLTLEITSVHCVRNGQLIQQLDLWHDPAGLIASATNSQQGSIFFNNQKINPVFSYTYDSCYRLQHATGRLQLQKGSLDSLENYTEAYLYDKSNNLTRLKRTCTNGFTRQFTIDERSNRITRGTLGKDNFTIGYNVAGYMLNTADTRSSSLGWNTGGNIAMATIIARENGPADAEYYVYSNGIRVRKVTERYDAAGKLINLTDKRYIGSYRRTAITTGDTMHSISVGGAGQRDCVVQYFTAQQSKGITKPPVYRFQQMENITVFSMETNLEGGLISYEEYNPFGDTVYSYGPAHLDSTREYRYSQQEKDQFTGLYYYGFRYYAPWLCRWTRPDPAGDIDGLNLYAFVGNDPVGKIDVLGLVRRKRTNWSNKRKPAAKRTPAKGVRKKRTDQEKAAAAKKRKQKIEEQNRKFGRRAAVSPRLRKREEEQAEKTRKMIARLKGHEKLAAVVTEDEIERTDNGGFDALIGRKLDNHQRGLKALDVSKQMKNLVGRVNFDVEFASSTMPIKGQSGLKILVAYGKIRRTIDVQDKRGSIDHIIPLNLDTSIHDRGHLIWQSANKDQGIDSDRNLISENAKVNQHAKTAWERRVNNLAYQHKEVHHLSIPEWDSSNNVTGVYHFSFTNRTFHEGIYFANPQKALLLHRA